MFRLTVREKTEVVANRDHLLGFGFPRHRPHLHTEHGALILASVRNSRVAVEVSVQIVRAIVLLRERLAANNESPTGSANGNGGYGHQFTVVFDAIRELMAQAQHPRHQIGFRASVEG
jgi:hypothetical protein